MEVRDPAVITTSLEDVVGWAEDVIQTKDVSEMHHVLIKLKDKIPPMSGRVYLALNKGTVDQLPDDEKFLAYVIQLKDALGEAIDACY